MGRDKARLPFGPECLLQRAVRLVSVAVPAERIVVVVAADQELPVLPKDVVVACDQRPARGPLEGLAAGLRACSPEIDALFVTGCDVPFLQSEFPRLMFEFLSDDDVVVPRDAEHRYPLAAVYRRSILPIVERLLSNGQLRLQDIFDSVRVREIPVDDLRSVDPALKSLINVNTPEEYLTALREFAESQE